MRKKLVSQLVEGDLVDLEGDSVADTAATDSVTREDFKHEWSLVCEVTKETDNCWAVYFENFSCGFPADHMFTVKR